MPQWSNSTRRDRLPADWPTIRRRILRRDENRCQARLAATGKKCRALANEVDHIKAGDDHRDENLRAICEWCHQKKSSAEGGQAQAAKRRAISKKFRRTEDHPGLV